MKTIKAYGTKPKGHPAPIISWLIRFIEWSPISHAAIDVGDGRIYHASFNKALFVNKEEWKKKNEIKYSFKLEIPEGNYSAMIEFMNSYEGKKKGYFKKLFGAFIPRIVKLFTGKHVKNTFVKGMEENAICTELVRFCALRFWNYKVPTLPYAENFTTKDFIRMMEANK